MSVPFWTVIELAEWALHRRAEAERLGENWITASEIYRGASRISNSVERFDAVVGWWIKQKREQGAAFVVLHRTRVSPADWAWVVHTHGNALWDPVSLREWTQREGVEVSRQTPACVGGRRATL